MADDAVGQAELVLRVAQQVQHLSLNRPEGSALRLEIVTQPNQNSPRHDALWERTLNAIGIRTRFATSQWAEQLNPASAGWLMTWAVGSNAASPDGLAQLNGPLAPRAEPGAACSVPGCGQCPKCATGTMQTTNDLVRPWLIGFSRPVFGLEWWHKVDIDEAQRPNP